MGVWRYHATGGVGNGKALPIPAQPIKTTNPARGVNTLSHAGFLGCCFFPRVKPSPKEALRDQAMLVLSRKVGERLLIGEGKDQVVFVVHRIAGNRVTVGIEAQDHIPIRRGELKTKESNVNPSVAKTKDVVA